MDWKEKIKTIKQGQEVFIHFEFWHLIKNTIIRGVETTLGCKFIEVIPEFPIEINKKRQRADIVIFAEKYNCVIPYLVIEVKKRTFTRPGVSALAALKRAKNYASKLKMLPRGFFGIYDGWILLIFRDIAPFLISASGPINSEEDIKNLLIGLEEVVSQNKFDLLNTLPPPKDPEFLNKRIFPSLIKAFGNIDESYFLKQWEEKLNKMLLLKRNSSK